MEAGTGLGEMTEPLARSFISKPKTSGVYPPTHTRGGYTHFLNFS